jgi:hypothetical protein
MNPVPVIYLLKHNNTEVFEYSNSLFISSKEKFKDLLSIAEKNIGSIDPFLTIYTFILVENYPVKTESVICVKNNKEDNTIANITSNNFLIKLYDVVEKYLILFYRILEIYIKLTKDYVSNLIIINYLKSIGYNITGDYAVSSSINMYKYIRSPIVQSPIITYLIWPISLFHLQRDDINIYIFGDQHIRQSICPKQNKITHQINLIQLVEQEIQINGNIEIDFFVELGVPYKNSKYTLRDVDDWKKGNNYFSYIFDTYKDCVKNNKSGCGKDNLRIHFIDNRYLSDIMSLIFSMTTLTLLFLRDCYQKSSEIKLSNYILTYNNHIYYNFNLFKLIRQKAIKSPRSKYNKIYSSILNSDINNYIDYNKAPYISFNTNDTLLEQKRFLEIFNEDQQTLIKHFNTPSLMTTVLLKPMKETLLGYIPIEDIIIESLIQKELNRYPNEDDEFKIIQTQLIPLLTNLYPSTRSAKKKISYILQKIHLDIKLAKVQIEKYDQSMDKAKVYLCGNILPVIDAENKPLDFLISKQQITQEQSDAWSPFLNLYEFGKILVDVYTIARLFKPITNENNIYTYPKNIIIYNGNDHAKNLTKFLTNSFNFKLKKTLNSSEFGKDFQCLDITDIQRPLFS